MKPHTNLSIVPSHEVTVPKLAEIEAILVGVPSMQRTKVLAETKLFYQARYQGALTYLAMGEHLANVRNVLEPLEKWKLYINLLPNIAQATAYRMIWAFENAQRALPTATRNVAIREGYKLIAAKKDSTFAPGYEAAVKKVIKEVGTAPEKDEQKAKEWLDAVLKAKRDLKKKTTSTSIDTTVTIESHEARIVKNVMQVIKGLPDEQKAKFGLKVAGMIINLCHSPVYKVKPVSVPEHYTERKAS